MAVEPISPALVRLTRRKPQRLAWWIDSVSLLLSAGGSLLAWHAYSQHDAELLTAGQAIVGVGFAAYLCGKVVRSLD
jgi:hypothetical protein